MSLKNFARQLEEDKLSEKELPGVEKNESQRPSEVELPHIRCCETNYKLDDYGDSERPFEMELPYCVNKENMDFAKNCPVENGIWEEERGNSKWIPDMEYTPQKKNPEQKTWKEILEEYEIDGVNFEDGEAVFDEISKGDVEIEAFSTNRDDNFDKADIELAKQKGCTPEEVAKWRKEHGYTWHECRNMKTMQKVPGIVHNNVSHRGGISEAKER